VHLGYCEHKDADGNPTVETAKDFNCRRNTKYTYNIEVQGANKIVVEAKQEDELQSGAEGSVLDDYGDYVAMDSHYCVYNIALTNKERKQLLYRVSSPFNGTTYVYESKNYNTKDPKTGKTRGDAWENDQLFTWIKIKPTTSMDVLAKYKENENDNNLWSLNDLLDVKGHPWAEWTIKVDGTVDASNEDSDETSKIVHYYTVFVDEYVYHNDIDGNPEGYLESLWYTYVNQDDRVVQLFLNNDYSPDSESDYTFCKYAFAQKSIQTYYKYDASNPENEVMGVEHTDENYGLNYRWRYMTPNGSDWYNTTSENGWCSPENGRFNARKYINAASMEKMNRVATYWDDYVSWTVPDNILAGTCTYMQISHDAELYPVPKLNDYCPGTPHADDGGGYDPTPDDNTLHYANAACMNRNRDLDGDGIISNKELRWYLPTDREYVQIGLGQIEMPDPLIKLLEHSKEEFCVPGQTDKSEVKRKVKYHYVASNCIYVWAEELISTGDRPFGYMPQKQEAYSVRCVRALGANPDSEPDSLSEISKPSTYDSSERTFTQTRYTDVSIRSYVGTYILPHDVGAEEGRPYKKFKLAKDVCRNITDDGILSVGSDGTVYFANASDEGTKSFRWYQMLTHNGICDSYYENSDKSDIGTWRVPTFREMGIMYNEGMLTEDQLSCSRNHFVVWPIEDGYTTDVWRYQFLGYRSDEKRLKRDIMQNRSGVLKIRCVKDVR
jgi:hypothetical protein